MAGNVIRERYNPTIAPANTKTVVPAQAIGGFLCVTAGSLELTDMQGKVLFTGFPVSAGDFYRIPFYVGQDGLVLTTSGGASGVIAT